MSSLVGCTFGTLVPLQYLLASASLARIWVVLSFHFQYSTWVSAKDTHVPNPCLTRGGSYHSALL